VTLDAALAGTDYLSVDWNEERESFIASADTLQKH
jgi:hypothetical protein